ncbi:MAG TPA: UDP-3-O-acyl-N-acetylglucosamine deacetylase, partial [Trueperaceae bacterium]|nr:UDP-3-O-acyl-N-acetylglucosamine deacetylase [Trueperaceae bacterium]
GEERLDVSIDFAHHAIGRQRWVGGPDDYHQLAAARTFGLLREAEALRARGLVRGASLEHAIVFADDGPLRPLRFPDEPVRHKALDAIGDLALLGRPLRAHVTLQRGSHSLHHALMSRLLSSSATSSRDGERPVVP